MGTFAAPSVQSQGAGDVVSEADGEPDPQHWGTGGSYILGGAGINSDLDKVNPKIPDLSLGTSFPDMGKTGKGVVVRGEPFDLTRPAYVDFPLRDIFTVARVPYFYLLMCSSSLARLPLMRE